jgi:hypothetical protein
LPGAATGADAAADGAEAADGGAAAARAPARSSTGARFTEVPQPAISKAHINIRHARIGADEARPGELQCDK